MPDTARRSRFASTAPGAVETIEYRLAEHTLACNHVDLARAGIDADLGWALPVDGSASAEWISFETPCLLGRIVLWDQGRYETTVALRRGGRPYVTERQDAASAEDLDQALVLLVDHLRTDRDPGPWWQAP